jgi:DNA-binding CsgD family transcriptional regulator
VEEAPSTAPGKACLAAAELRLLPYLPTYLSFREIGERLSVSPHTVKSQAISVYRKLDVTSRSEAIEHARLLGLLDPLSREGRAALRIIPMRRDGLPSPAVPRPRRPTARAAVGLR